MPSASSLHRKEVMSLDFSETSGFRPEPAVSKFYSKPLTYQPLTTVINTVQTIGNSMFYKTKNTNSKSKREMLAQTDYRLLILGVEIPAFRHGGWILILRLGRRF